MKRFTVLASLMLALALLFGGAVQAQEPLRIAKAEKSKKPTKGKAGTHKRKHKPLAPVKPSVPKDYQPPFLTSPSTRIAIKAYQKCMYENGESSEERIQLALELNLAYKSNIDLRAGKSHPEKIGLEICLSDAIGLKRYQTQKEIDEVKGGELVRIDSPHILFPQFLPEERHYARPWVKEYVEGLAEDLHEHLKSKHAGQDFPRLRVTSLVRSLVAQQRQSSPAKCRTVICSTHLTGSTVDISNSEAYVVPEVRAWIRERLLKDRREGKILVIEEFSEPHFHIFVIPPEYRGEETP